MLSDVLHGSFSARVSCNDGTRHYNSVSTGEPRGTLTGRRATIRAPAAVMSLLAQHAS